MREKMKHGPDRKPGSKSAEMVVASSEDETGSEWETATETETESEYGHSIDSQQLSVDVEQPRHAETQQHHHRPVPLPKAPTAAEKRERIAAAKDAARVRITAEQTAAREKEISSTRKKLKELRLGPLQRRAAAEGVDEGAQDQALESADPTASIIELIVVKLDAEEESPRQQAIAEEIKAAADDEEARIKDEVDHARAAAEEENARVAAEAEAERFAAERAAAAEAARVAAEKTLFAKAIANEESRVRAELAELRLGPLQRRARQVGFDDDELDTALEAADPMVAMVELITAKHMVGFKPSGVSSTINPAYNSDGKEKQEARGWSEMTIVDSNDEDAHTARQKPKQPTKLEATGKKKQQQHFSSSTGSEMVVVEDSDEEDTKVDSKPSDKKGLRNKLEKKRQKTKARNHMEKLIAKQEKLDEQVRKRQKQEAKRQKKAGKHEGSLLANPMFGLDDSLDEQHEHSGENPRQRQKEEERLRKKAARQPQAILKKRMRGTYMTCAEAVVREQYEQTSTKIGTMKQPGVYVEVTDARETEDHFIRVKIRPSQYENKEVGFQIVYGGWCSVVSKSGVPILRKLTEKELEQLEEARWDDEAED